MAITSLQKILNIGHPISFYISDPNKSINTSWTGFGNPTNQYVNPPSPYTETSGNKADVDNIEKSTGFKDISIGLETTFLRVPHDGTNENSNSVALGGGFVSSTAPSQQITITQNQNSIDVDITALLKWYLQNNGGATRMKVLSKGTLNKVQDGNTPTPYGYDLFSTPFAETPLPSESYMITQSLVGNVDGIEEIVTDQNRRATVEFYSFGETADQYPRFRGSYKNDPMTNTNTVANLSLGAMSVSVEPTNNATLTIVLNKTIAAVDNFWKKIKTSILDPNIAAQGINFKSIDGNITVGSSIGTAVFDGLIEDENQVTLIYVNYDRVNEVGARQNTPIQDLSFDSNLGIRKFFDISKFFTGLSGTAGPVGDQVFLNDLQTVNDGTYLYFPQGLTFVAGLPLGINGSGTKRFKIKQAYVSGTNLRLETTTAFSNNSSSSALNSIQISTGQFRPKLIVSYQTT
jgi:hypothetical protein